MMNSNLGVTTFYDMLISKLYVNDCRCDAILVEFQGQGLSNENNKQELQNLERQLEHAIMEKNKLQVDFNCLSFCHC